MRPISEIAREIRTDMLDQGTDAKPAKLKFHTAWPYLVAMLQLNSVRDNYYYDSGKSVVLYFLSNATTWKGETARRIKAELREMVK